jgi:hypothetical protein
MRQRIIAVVAPALVLVVLAVGGWFAYPGLTDHTGRWIMLASGVAQMFPSKLVECLRKYGGQIRIIERSAWISDHPLFQHSRQEFSEIVIESTTLTC